MNPDCDSWLQGDQGGAVTAVVGSCGVTQWLRGSSITPAPPPVYFTSGLGYPICTPCQRCQTSHLPSAAAPRAGCTMVDSGCRPDDVIFAHVEVTSSDSKLGIVCTVAKVTKGTQGLSADFSPSFTTFEKETTCEMERGTGTTPQGRREVALSLRGSHSTAEIPTWLICFMP